MALLLEGDIIFFQFCLGRQAIFVDCLWIFIVFVIGCFASVIFMFLIVSHVALEPVKLCMPFLEFV